MSKLKIINKILQCTSYQVKRINLALNCCHIHSVNINIEHFLAKLLLEKKEFFFVQIGANDGIRADDAYNFITRNKLKGIVVEPLKDMFEKLCKNYVYHPQIIKINKAIHSSAKEIPLYRIKSDADVPDWCHGIASFDKNHLLNKKEHILDFDKYIVEESVDCITLDELFTITKTDHISFLQIDTEGYDFEIIKMLDFKKYRPQIIRYEYNLLSKNDNLACIELLNKYGYKFFEDGNNIIALFE